MSQDKPKASERRDGVVSGRFTVTLDGERIVLECGDEYIRMSAQEAFDLGILLGSYGVAVNQGMFPMTEFKSTGAAS